MQAICSWGDGPDVLLNLQGTYLLLHEEIIDKHKAVHGYCKSGSIDLAADEAIQLAHELLAAAYSAKALEKGYLSEMCRRST